MDIMDGARREINEARSIKNRHIGGYVDAVKKGRLSDLSLFLLD